MPSNSTQIKISEPLILTRFTNTQFNKILALPDGATFTHINLQHYGIPTEFQSDHARNQLGVRILEFGRNTESGEHEPPTIDQHTRILLEQVGFSHSIPVNQPGMHTNLVLSDDRSIPCSLLANYGEVMDLTLEDLLQMKYFVRVFRKFGVVRQ